MFLHASESPREYERHVFESANAILFIGTPHRGANFVDRTETVRRIVCARGFDTTHQNIHDLSIDSTL